MTIQLLHAFNGYSPGIYSNMGAPEEARLISLGLARAYVKGMDGKSSSAALTRDAADAAQAKFEADGGFGGSTTLGPVADLTALNSTYPAASYAGREALVGASAPYSIYDSNGAAWSLRGSGGGSVITLTTSRSITSSDNGGTLVYSGSTDITLTVPSGLTSGFSCTVAQAGLGRVLFTQGGGVGFDNAGATTGINTFTTVIQVSTDQYAFQNPLASGPVTLYQSAIPFIHNSSWSFGANGALTLTGLNTTYPNAYVYFPADAIATGVPAGWYYTVFSSTTAGTVYNNRYTSGKPTIPSSPTVFATSAGSVTAQVTTAVTGPQFTVPGGSLGPNGLLETRAFWLTNNSVNTKAASILLNSSQIVPLSTSGSNVAVEISNILQNAGTQARQVLRAGQLASLTGVPIYATIDTSVDTTFSMTFTLGTVATGDYLILQRMYVNQQYGAA